MEHVDRIFELQNNEYKITYKRDTRQHRLMIENIALMVRVKKNEKIFDEEIKHR